MPDDVPACANSSLFQMITVGTNLAYFIFAGNGSKIEINTGSL
jgi:hypothetical protein